MEKTWTWYVDFAPASPHLKHTDDLLLCARENSHERYSVPCDSQASSSPPVLTDESSHNRRAFSRQYETPSQADSFHGPQGIYTRKQSLPPPPSSSSYITDPADIRSRPHFPTPSSSSSSSSDCRFQTDLFVIIETPYTWETLRSPDLTERLLSSGVRTLGRRKETTTWHQTNQRWQYRRYLTGEAVGLKTNSANQRTGKENSDTSTNHKTGKQIQTHKLIRKEENICQSERRFLTTCPGVWLFFSRVCKCLLSLYRYPDFYPQ